MESATTADVVVSVQVARAHQLPLGVQNTGHGIAKACNGGLLLKLDKLTHLDLDVAARRVRVGPGVH